MATMNIWGKLASQARLWYNRGVNIVMSEDADNIALTWIHLFRRCIMDTIPQDNTPRKQCKNLDCQQWFPSTPEFFSRDKTKKDGLHGTCKLCKSKQDKAYRERPEIHEDLVAKKKNYASRADIRERRRVKDATPEAREHRRIYRSNPDIRSHERAYEEIYHSQPEIQERYRVYRQAYNQRPDIQEHRRFYHSQPDVRVRYKTHTQKRRALNLNAPGTHTPEQIKEQYERQKGRCYYCRCKVAWNNHHVDHVVPLSRGGSNDISNLVIACQTCNLSKNSKLPHEWARGNRLL
jgi:5-methylcytosine-specific restriction endonuclease McrA